MTFGIKTEGADKAKKDIDGVASASKNAEGAQDGLNNSIESGTGALDKMTGGAIGAFKGVVSGVKKAVLGMKTLRGAVISTGIGALVVVVIALISYFTKTKRGAEALQVATAALGVVMDLLTDKMSGLGEIMVKVFVDPKQSIIDFGTAIQDYILDNIQKMIDGMGLLGSAIKKTFSGDFSGALEDAKEGAVSLGVGILKLNPITAVMVGQMEYLVENVDGFTESVKKAVKSAIAYEKRSIALADAQRNLSVEFAQTREKMTALKLVSEDVNETMEKRIAATEEMGALEIALADKSLVLAQEAVDIKRSQNALSESTAEDLQALADLEIALSNAQIESSGKQTEILMKVNSLYKEQEANILATEASEAEALAEKIARQAEIDDIVDAGRERDIQKIKDHWAEQIRIAKENGDELIGAAEAQRIQIAEVDKKYDAQSVAEAKITTQQKLGLASSLLGSIMALNSALAGSSKKEQKEAFQRNKKMGIVSAVINTAGAIIGAINPAAGGIPLPWGAVGAAAAALSGAAQIAVIAKSRFASPDTSIPPPPSVGGSGGGASEVSTAPQLDLSFLGEGAGGSIQAYVISENVTNQQQADQIVTDQTTL